MLTWMAVVIVYIILTLLAVIGICKCASKGRDYHD